MLETSRLWREVVERVVQDEFPDVALEHMLVDAAAMHLIRRPRDFDVIVTENMFGDILTDEASMLAGSLGPAALGLARRRHARPVRADPRLGARHRRQGIANPFGTILSAALLLRHSLGLEAEAAAVERAVEDAISAGVRTADIAAPGQTAVGSREAGSAVVERLLSSH